MILGIDTAAVGGNNNPNWQKMKVAGYTFAIIRATYGATKDKTFDRDWSNIKAAGITRGAYMFWRAGMDAGAQVDAFCNIVYLDDDDLPPVLDVEFTGGRKKTGKSIVELLDEIEHIVCRLKRAYGRTPMIYTSARVWKEDLGNKAPAADVLECPLWLARYTSVNVDPPVPPPWGDATNWWIHQYKGDAIGIEGFPTGNVDLNRFNPMMLGSKGDRVKRVQNRLCVKSDGIFGKNTDKALREFQKDRRLVPDGIIGPRTFAQLMNIGE